MRKMLGLTAVLTLMAVQSYAWSLSDLWKGEDTTTTSTATVRKGNRHSQSFYAVKKEMLEK
ncbi:MAG: hypothetical protein J6Y91_03660, partial [Alphaproteobacteria bacterium]|nr:hypothetical protein [Alphaproteobacteria bacterium]